MLLMFGVGLHFSLKDLLSVKRIAIPGAVVQMSCATHAWHGAGVVVGLAVGPGFAVRRLAVVCEHRGAAEGPGGPRGARHHERPHRRWLAGGRRSGHGAGPRASAPTGCRARRHRYVIGIRRLAAVDHRLDLAGGGRLHRPDDGCRAQGDSVVPLASGGHRLARIVHAGRGRGRHRHCLWRRASIQRLVCLGRIFRRHGDARVGIQPSCSARISALARCIFSPVLRLGRHALPAGGLARQARAGLGRDRHHHVRQDAGGFPDRHRLPLSAEYCPDRGGQPRPDR